MARRKELGDHLPRLLFGRAGLSGGTDFPPGLDAARRGIGAAAKVGVHPLDCDVAPGNLCDATKISKPKRINETWHAAQGRGSGLGARGGKRSRWPGKTNVGP